MDEPFKYRDRPSNKKINEMPVGEIILNSMIEMKPALALIMKYIANILI